MLKHISYSYLHILACPYAAFLRYQAAVRGPTTSWLALGNALHYALELGHSETIEQAIEDHVRTFWNFKVAVPLFKREFQRIIDDEQVSIGWPQIKKLEGEGIEMLGRYNEQVLDGIIASEPMALEKEFKLPFMGTEIVGRIDKVEFDDGYIITDFKSGKTEPTAWFLAHNLQLTAYAWACKEMYGELPKAVVWHHLRNGKLLSSTRTEEDIADLQRLISNAIKMNEQGMRHRIFHEQVCGQCDYMGDTCSDKELEKQTLINIENGVRPDTTIVLRQRGW